MAKDKKADDASGLVIEPHHDLSAFCESNGIRYAIDTVRFSDGFAEATDGRVLARVPCKSANGTSFIHGRDLNAVFDRNRGHNKSARFVNGHIEVTPTKLVSEAKWPDTKGPRESVKPSAEVNVDFRILKSILDYIAKHTNAEFKSVKLEIGKAGEPIRISCELPNDKGTAEFIIATLQATGNW